MKAKGIWVEAARMDALSCYDLVKEDGTLASGFIDAEDASSTQRRTIRLDGFNIAKIERLLHRWRQGERLAEESLSALFELIVERGDAVPSAMREFAILRIRGEKQGRAKKSPWENAERDEAIRRRLEEVRRSNPGIPLYPTRRRKGDGTSATEIVAAERGMEPDAVIAIWRRIAKPGYFRR